MIILKIITAFLVGSGLDTAIFKLIFSGYIIFEFFIVKRGAKLQLSNFAWYLIIFFVLGLINMLIFISFFDFPVSNSDVLIRGRYYFIEISFAFCVYLFFRTRTKKDIMDVLLYSIVFNSIAGVIQFILSPTERLQMLFSEPSAAGFYYCFIIFILLAHYKESLWKIIVSRVYVLFGILIFSKGQFLTLGLVHIFKASRKFKLILIVCSIIILSIFIENLSMVGNNFSQFDQVLNVFVQISKHGIEGLSEKYKVWSSFVTRLSGIYVSLLSLVEYPNGLGFGGFHGYYVNWVKHSGIDIASIETDEIAKGVKYASPRSHLLELFISTGLIGLILYIKMFIAFLKRGRKDYLYVSFLSLTIVAFVLELNPFFCYLGILISLFEKEKDIVRNQVRKMKLENK